MAKRIKNRSMSMYSGPLNKMIEDAVALRMSALKDTETTRTQEGIGSDQVKGVRTLTEIIKSTATSTKPGETTRGKGPGYKSTWTNLSEEEKARFGSLDNFVKESEAWHDKNTTPDETVETEIETEREIKKANLQMPREVDISEATGVRGDFNVIDPETKELVPYSSLMQNAQKNEDGLLVNGSGQPYYGQPIAKFAPELKGSESSGFTLNQGRQFNPNSNSAYMGDFKNSKDMIQGMGYTIPSLNQAIKVPVSMNDNNEVQYNTMTVSQFAKANPDSIENYGDKNLMGVNLQRDYKAISANNPKQAKTGGAGGRQGQSNQMMNLDADGNFQNLGFGQFGSYKSGGDNSIQPYGTEVESSDQTSPEVKEENNTVGQFNMNRNASPKGQSKMIKNFGKPMSFRKNR